MRSGCGINGVKHLGFAAKVLGLVIIWVLKQRACIGIRNGCGFFQNLRKKKRISFAVKF